MLLRKAARRKAAAGFSHEALPYSGMGEFTAGTRSFLGQAVRAGDPALVIATRLKAEAIRAAMGDAAGQIRFAEVPRADGNPARLIPAWREFARVHPGAAQIWGVCEPVHPGRSAAELAECQLHEALLNIAFDASAPVRLLCPYDLRALGAGVIEDAHRTHPFITRGGRRRPSATFRPIDLAAPFARRLPARPAGASCLTFGAGGLQRVRSFVAAHTRLAGLDRQSAAALMTAASEVASNSLQHGGGHGEARAWTEDQWLVCEVSDRGHLTAPLAGRLPPGPAAPTGSGLWLANQLSDLVQICSSADGTAIRVHQRRSAASDSAAT
jgi:anti-sigma regulatory factor (Ser/Thr protein kinase)